MSTTTVRNNAYYLDLQKKFLIGTYAPPMVLQRAKGDFVYDVEGNEYIDLGGGIAVLAVGHNHPKLVGALEKQSHELWHLSNAYTNVVCLDLAQRLCESTFAQKVFFSNSGAEANEAAIKLARKYYQDKGKTEKYEFICFEGAFHGRTMATVTAGGQKKYSGGLGPMFPGIHHAVFNDLESVKKFASKDKTAAIMLEPVQGEGGIIPCDKEFIKGIKSLCQELDILLIFDEVQTGVGRTGSLYAYQQLGVTPDILTSAKGLGGGIPIAATLTTDAIASCFGVGSHGSTFGGNPLACSVSLATLSIIDQTSVYEGVKKKHDIILNHFNELSKKPEFKNLLDTPRGMGLLVGVPVKDPYKEKAKDIRMAAMKRGVMVLLAGNDVIRFAPSLIISDDTLKEGLVRFTKGLEDFLKN